MSTKTYAPPQLYGWLSAEDNIRATRETLDFLSQQGVTVYQESPFIILIDKTGVWWTLDDNGGELNLIKINYTDLDTEHFSIPYTSTFGILDTLTMCYRILTKLNKFNDGKIDYHFIAGNGTKLYVPI